MANAILQGLAPKLQQHLLVLAGQNDPSAKITPAGFTKFLVDKTPSIQIPDYEVLRLSNSRGHVKSIELYTYSRAGIGSQGISETPSCDNGVVPLRKAFTLEAPRYVQAQIVLPDNLIEQYAEDASQMVQLQGAPTLVMNEMLQEIMAYINGLVATINTRLVSDVTFGKNIVTGSTASTTVNIAKDATLYDLSQGLVKILADARNNEMIGNLNLVGGGLFLNYEISKGSAGVAANGQNQALVGGYGFNFDTYTGSAANWGSNANALGVFQDGTIGFIDLSRMLGFKQRNLGTYQSFQIVLPIENGAGNVTTMTFDVKLIFSPCPKTEIADDGYSEFELQEGWNLIISKRYGLYQMPTSVYSSTDRLAGSNGALLYNITNS